MNKLGYFVIFWSLLLASTAAFFSIEGLMLVFAASALPVMIMGICIEGGKLIGAVLLHKHWDNKKYSTKKLYLLSAVIAAMFITAIGIFGFLFSAHFNQEAPIHMIELQISGKEQEVAHIRDANVQLDKNLAQLDSALSILAKNEKASLMETTRKNQRSERDNILKAKIANDAQINTLENTIVKMKQDTSGVTAKLGPLKAIADTFGWNDTSAAVKLLVGIIMWCFDPLAIVLEIWGVTMLEEASELRDLKKEQQEQKRIKEALEAEEKRKKEEELLFERQKKEAEKERKRTGDEKRKASLERRAEMQEQRKLLEIELNNKYKKEADELRSQLDLIKEISEDTTKLYEDNIHLKDESSRKEQEISALCVELENKNKELQTFHEEELRLVQMIDELEASHQEQTVDGQQLELLVQDNQVLINTISSKEKEILDLKERIEYLQDLELDVVHVTDEETIDRINAVTAENNDLQLKINNIENEKSSIENDISVLQKKIEDLEVTLSVKEETINVLNSEIIEKEDALSLLPSISTEELEILQGDLDKKNKELVLLRDENKNNIMEIEIRNNELKVLCDELEIKANRANQYTETLRDAFFSNDKDKVIAMLENSPEVMDDIIDTITTYQKEKVEKIYQPIDSVINYEENNDKVIVEINDTIGIHIDDVYSTKDEKLYKYNPEAGWLPDEERKLNGK